MKNKRLQERSPAIALVSPVLRNGDEAIYTPKLVSIGPYHHENDELQEMLEVKLKYLGDLIQRSPRNLLENFVKIVKANAEEAMEQYSIFAKDELTSEELTRMMVVDGCFIIEFLAKWYLNDKLGHANSVKTKLPALRNDLLLVENQIPFKILEALFGEADIPQFFLLHSCVLKISKPVKDYTAADHDGPQLTSSPLPIVFVGLPKREVPPRHRF